MLIWYVYRAEHPLAKGCLGRVLSVHQHESEALRARPVGANIIQRPLEYLRGGRLYENPVYGSLEAVEDEKAQSPAVLIETPEKEPVAAPAIVSEPTRTSNDVFLWEAATGKPRRGSPRIHIRAIADFENDEVLMRPGETLCGVRDTLGKSRGEPITCPKCKQNWKIAFGVPFEG